MKKSIPFQIVELEKNSYHLLISGIVNKKEYLFVIDSGASKSLIDIKLAERLRRIPIKADTPIATGIMAEKISVELVSVPKIIFNKIEFNRIEAVVTDLSAINEIYKKMTGKTIGGLIGCDFLVKRIKKIDLREKNLTIKKKIKSKKIQADKSNIKDKN